MLHDLKILPEWFMSVITGVKTFEIRKDDRNFQPRDMLRLREWDGKAYTGRMCIVDVTMVLRDEYCREGYCTMAIRLQDSGYPIPEFVNRSCDNCGHWKNTGCKCREWCCPPHSKWIPMQSGWIPCSVKMPEDIKPVYITWYNPFIDYTGTGFAHYFAGNWYWYSQCSEDVLSEYGEYGDTVDVDVIAWMPMPEAYKPPEGGEHYA